MDASGTREYDLTSWPRLRLVLGLVVLLVTIREAAFAQPTRLESPVEISNVFVSALSFAPSINQALKLQYSLARDCRITIKIFDPDQDLVRVLASKTPRKAGLNTESWDGRDM